MGDFEFLPHEFGEWRQIGSRKTYNRETIFEYIDGAGEVYRLYDFQQVAVFTLTRDKIGTITVEIFDMGLPGDAYGIFTFYHEGQDLDIGDGAYLRPELLSFWRGKYFICVSAESPMEHSAKYLAEVARTVAATIPQGGQPPEWLAALPAKGRRPQSLRYFHNHQSLNYHYFVDEKNILRLTEKTECALAAYRRGERGYYQLWVRYPNSAAADAAYDHFMRIYHPGKWRLGVVQEKEEGWTALTKHHEFLALAFNVPTAAVADSVQIMAKDILREVTK
ncbi:DUF6599 family protein [Candidatus Zixiibacteriota bacterium]